MHHLVLYAHVVGSKQSNKDMCLLMAKVMPSQQLNSELNTAWGAVEKSTGTSHTAGHCTCMVGNLINFLTQYILYY